MSMFPSQPQLRRSPVNAGPPTCPIASRFLLSENKSMRLLLIVALFQTLQAPSLQLMQPSGSAAAPVVITLQDALERAKNFDVNYQAALTDATVAKGDRVQA